MRDKPFGAFCHHDPVSLPGRPGGPLSGCRFVAKDLFQVAGRRACFGNPDWLASHGPAEATADAITRLLEAGASLSGMTLTDELAWSLAGENAHYGTPENPAAPGRVAGGSSSGTAAALAGGLADFGLGTDTGGSVRLPASFCGLWGLRPSHGAVSAAGVLPLAPGFDTVGWMARDPRLLGRVGEVLLPAGDAPLPGRLILAQDAFAAAAPGVAEALAPALARVEALLGRAEPLVLAPEGLSAWADIFRVVQWAEAWECHGEWISRASPRLGPGIRERAEGAERLTPAEAAAGRAAREDVAARLSALLSEGALLVLPTVPDVAPPPGRPPEAVQDFRLRCAQMLCIAVLGRLPQVTLPLAVKDGCPLGLSLIGPRGSDRMLLDLAARV